LLKLDHLEHHLWGEHG